MSTTAKRVLAGAGVAATLVLGTGAAAHAQYPPTVDPTQTATVPVTVVDPASTKAGTAVAGASQTSALAFTGTQALGAGAAALVLVAAGTTLVVRSRKQGAHS